VKKGPEGEAVSLDLVERTGAVTLRVRVQPRASREELVGAREGALVVRLTAPPVEGAANKALTRLLGKKLGVPPSAVVIAAGSTSRSKLVVVNGVSASEVLSRLDVGRTGSRGNRS
jgi:uncharacterized protein (TIGR00251 family)